MSGICTDALNAGGAPTATELRAAGADGARVVAFPTDQFVGYTNDLSDNDLTVAVVLARESFPDDEFGAWSAWYADRVWPRYFLVGNEFDAWMLDAESPSSWSMRPAAYADLFKACAEAILARNEHAEIFLGGLVAGQPAILPEYLDAIREIYDGPIAGFTAHPYGRGAESARELIREYGQVWDDYWT